MLLFLLVPIAMLQAADARASLLDADRQLGAASPGTNAVAHLTRAFAPGISLIAGGRVARGVDSARALLLGNPAHATAEIEWAPIAVGISADGNTGYTFGHTVMRVPGQPEQRGKYLAFWARQNAQWRMLVFKRTAGTAETPLPLASGAVELWPRTVAQLARGDSVRFAAGLRDTELAFSASAPGLGLGEAFRVNSAPDGAHTGGPQDASFRRGPAAIAEGVGSVGPGESISWAPSLVHVAATGDVGVTVGIITVKGADSPAREFGFCTIWKRASPADPWKLAVE